MTGHWRGYIGRSLRRIWRLQSAVGSQASLVGNLLRLTEQRFGRMCQASHRGRRFGLRFGTTNVGSSTQGRSSRQRQRRDSHRDEWRYHQTNTYERRPQPSC